MILSYISQIYQPLEDLTTTITNFQQWFINLLMAFDLLDRKPEITEKPDARPLNRARGEIELDGVGFDYDGRSDVLKDITAQIPPGRAIAVVGPTGAGKSTLVSLLPRFYDPKEGSVRIDGEDVRDLKLARRAQPVQHRAPGAPPLLRHDRQQHLIREAGCPHGGGHRGGQSGERARLHLGDCPTATRHAARRARGARSPAVSASASPSLGPSFEDAPILILDEPTSSIDSRTEAVILDALDRLMQGRTTILIAHRLSTLRSVDEILVMNDGADRPAWDPRGAGEPTRLVSRSCGKLRPVARAHSHRAASRSQVTRNSRRSGSPPLHVSTHGM